MRTIVYADGGCDPNPGPGGWGVVIQAADGPVELHGGDRVTTNNRMELTAAISALEYFPEGAAIEMRCDSQYVVKSVTEWMPGWKRRGWRTATGPVKNVDLMERLDSLARTRDVRWTWVRGHSGEVGNERADVLATLGRREILGERAKPQEAPARSPEPTAAATIPFLIEVGLAGEIARAAERLGLPQAVVIEDALRLALELGPEGVARTRKALALDSARRPAKAS
ncbi:ribonuclease HI [Methylobacterium haplocladii]|uniref:Ribonuclease H n=1 Tax=Methylobacterium haplocladii TaxID=1176176 RepID=A0A512IJZ3_9HYPH|nr:ribonuclease HI [Methylobacterium haplocladii]GEO98019.1 hypothetical protein MHA02_04070 [Methylobacterium haplocladii]GJD86459.1 Ribonuclease H [Methylobacterium haplocladii]GLS57920.1 hypothetical protein GCM10007887_05760 [Methylobacterium haplocladii]